MTTPVAIYLCDPTTADSAVVADCLGVLSAEERERASRFAFEHLRRDYAVAHALVRTALSRHAEVAPAEWKFRTNTHGHPTVDSPVSHRSLRFNLSHTKGLSAVAVCRAREVGVDVEHRHVDAETVALARTHFASAESADVLSRAVEERAEQFLRYWTLKEAYIKARGLGLAIPLDGFWFDLGVAPPRITFDEAKVDDSTQDWEFREYRPTPRHVLSLAVRGAVGAMELEWVAVEAVAVRQP